MVVGIELLLSMGWKWSDLTLLNENFIKNIFGLPRGDKPCVIITQHVDLHTVYSAPNACTWAPLSLWASPCPVPTAH